VGDPGATQTLAPPPPLPQRSPPSPSPSAAVGRPAVAAGLPQALPLQPCLPLPPLTPHSSLSPDDDILEPISGGCRGGRVDPAMGVLQLGLGAPAWCSPAVTPRPDQDQTLPVRSRSVTTRAAPCRSRLPLQPVSFLLCFWWRLLGRSKVVRVSGRPTFAGGRGVVLEAVAGVAGLARVARLPR
jgi:hypothetical protein